MTIRPPSSRSSRWDASGGADAIGANGEKSNAQAVELILQEFGLPEGSFDFVPDRPGHDRRYAIDSSKLRSELGWSSRYTDFPIGLRETIRWYTQREDWWGLQNECTEAR